MYLKEKKCESETKNETEKQDEQETVGKWTWGKANAEIYLIR